MALIRVPRLGRHGRFGNQIFQHAFGRLYARRNQCDLELGWWVGREWFGLEDKPISGIKLPVIREKHEHGEHDAIIPNLKPQPVDCDFEGYFQYRTSYYLADQAGIQSRYRPLPRFEAHVRPLLDRLRSLGHTIVSVHVRRGDSGRKAFFLSPIEWYVRWLRRHWSRFDKPVLFVASDDSTQAAHFSEFSPQTSAGVSLDGAYDGYNYLRREETAARNFYPDFYVLQNSDVVLIPGNSTFAFTAAWTNPNVKETWHSSIRTQSFEQVNIWDVMPFDMYQTRSAYPNVPGAWLDSNPQWRG